MAAFFVVSSNIKNIQRGEYKMSEKLNLEKFYDTIDKMEEMRRYRPPTKGYFPSAAEVNTYINSDMPYMLPYMLWLDSCLSPEQVAANSEGVKALRDIVNQKIEKGEIIG